MSVSVPVSMKTQPEFVNVHLHLRFNKDACKMVSLLSGAPESNFTEGMFDLEVPKEPGFEDPPPSAFIEISDRQDKPAVQVLFVLPPNGVTF